MRICPNCQTRTDDDAQAFCLNCGARLPSPHDEPQTRIGASNAAASRSSNSNRLIAAILSGFALFAVTIGGLGAWYFSRQEERAANKSDNRRIVNANNDSAVNSGEAKSPVEVINNRKINNANNSKISNSNQTATQIIASASSVRKPEKGNYYFPNFAFDNNPATAWCEGVKGAGIGEWLQFNFAQTVALKAIKIMPGYFKNQESWAKNNRVANVEIAFSNNTIRSFTLADAMTQQTLDVGGVQTNSVKITIKNIYSGTSDSEDTLISEVSFVTEP